MAQQRSSPERVILKDGSFLTLVHIHTEIVNLVDRGNDFVDHLALLPKLYLKKKMVFPLLETGTFALERIYAL